jgi:hypothetical protein
MDEHADAADDATAFHRSGQHAKALKARFGDRYEFIPGDVRDIPGRFECWVRLMIGGPAGQRMRIALTYDPQTFKPTGLEVLRS